MAGRRRTTGTLAARSEGKETERAVRHEYHVLCQRVFLKLGQEGGDGLL